MSTNLGRVQEQDPSQDFRDGGVLIRQRPSNLRCKAGIYSHQLLGHGPHHQVLHAHLLLLQKLNDHPFIMSAICFAISSKFASSFCACWLYI